MARWNFDPLLLTMFALSLALFVRGRGKIKRPTAFLVAYSLAALIFLSPICALASALFSVRVVHHIALTAIIVPLIVLSFEKATLSLPTFSVFAAPVHAITFWSWHFPPVYEFAMTTDFHYWIMQATLAVSSALLWHSVRAASGPYAILILLFTTLQMGLLGALLTFAVSPLFAPHLFTTDAWGLSSLEDQQLAGAIMWVLGSGIYLLAALVVALRLLVITRAAKC
jgi:putative membrane protein